MYDAKRVNNEEAQKENTSYNTICDRSYFDKAKIDNVINTKTSHIPIENIFYE